MTISSFGSLALIVIDKVKLSEIHEKAKFKSNQRNA